MESLAEVKQYLKSTDSKARTKKIYLAATKVMDMFEKAGAPEHKIQYKQLDKDDDKQEFLAMLLLNPTLGHCTAEESTETSR